METPAARQRGREAMERSEHPAHRVVVVGGGFGGLGVSQALAGCSGIEVTLIDRLNPPLSHPLPYRVATAVLAPGEIAQPLRGLLGRNPNVRVLLAEMTGVDTKA